MKIFTSIQLKSGAVITIENDILICRNTDDTIIPLTIGQQKLLKKLANNVNRPIPFDELYAAYTNDAQQLTYAGNANSNIAKMKRTFPDLIRDSIKNVRGLGYYLEGSISTSSPQLIPASKNVPVTELTGDYYGFYLDPLGDGTLLNTYLHIENIGTESSPQIVAYIISGIRNRQVLLSQKLGNMFSSNTLDPKETFESFRETLSENDKRCSFGSGTVTFEDNLAIIELKMNHGKWEILLDFENYLKGNRKKKAEKDYYRGGFGLVLASRSIHGTYCLRIGLVRKSFMKDSLCADNKKLLEILKLQDGSRDAEWKPLKLSGFLDKHWYNMIMGE